ncbi:hypothetical protein F751_2319 [Auxenochlorella protothecoides]|uniref:GAF domain-containing protein n=1 Tax=Auxenochlorella protothecoides TaxID=3075 RepID=A0A087SFU7_AUXPR|nr:hypothetical protein F751_2319 [Auxenochlorella protothecoides]KFM24601.1 hypothetical protein F751_2319 [Auxenochlorella protothecoides]
MAQSYRALVATLTAHIREEVLAGAGAALLQVWACRDLEEGIVLSTQGLPYFLLGDGDELALFRYMSTKHCFPLGEALGQGTPASVFHNRQGCAIVDLAALDAADCPRADCAGACAAHSVLLLPLLDRMMGMKGEPLAVLEGPLPRGDDCDADLWAAAASALGITPPRLMSGRRTAMFVPGGWNDGVGAGLDGLGLELLGAHSPLRAGGL